MMIMLEWQQNGMVNFWIFRKDSINKIRGVR